jgi:hypothetical protein
LLIIRQAKTFLDADAFDLWEAALKHTTTIESVNGAPALIELFPLAVFSLNNCFDMLGKVTTIVESYFLLAGVGILQVSILLSIRDMQATVSPCSVTPTMSSVPLRRL